MIYARIIDIHANGETSSIIGKFDSQNAAKERARNNIEFGRDVVATLVFTTDPIAHYEAVDDGTKRADGTTRFKAKVAVGFKGGSQL